MTLRELENLLNKRLVEFSGREVAINFDFYYERYKCINNKLLRELLRQMHGFDFNFHMDLHDFINSVLEDIGVNDMLSYQRGIIRFNKSLSFDLSEVFYINVELKNNVVYQRETTGVIDKVIVRKCGNVNSNLTLLELFEHNKVKEKNKLLDCYKEKLQSKLAEIEELKKNITELETELKTSTKTML